MNQGAVLLQCSQCDHTITAMATVRTHTPRHSHHIETPTLVRLTHSKHNEFALAKHDMLVLTISPKLASGLDSLVR